MKTDLARPMADVELHSHVEVGLCDINGAWPLAFVHIALLRRGKVSCRGPPLHSREQAADFPESSRVIPPWLASAPVQTGAREDIQLRSA